MENNSDSKSIEEDDVPQNMTHKRYTYTCMASLVNAIAYLMRTMMSVSATKMKD